MTDTGVTTARLDDQIHWYDEKSVRAQRMFKVLKAVTIIAAAGVPIVGSLTVRNRVSLATPRRPARNPQAALRLSHAATSA